MSSRLSLRRLSGFSRRLATMEKGARGPERRLCADLGKDIEDGCTFTEALSRRGDAFPVFFLRLVHVGERVGMLGHVLTRLADYYDGVREMWKRLITRMIYPVFQYWALIFVLALVAYIMGMLGQRPSGDRDALRILITGAAIFAAPFVLYFVVARGLGATRVLVEVAMATPVLGYVLRSMALARFSWSMGLMTDAGVNILDAVRWSLQATSNPAFIARGEAIVKSLKDGIPVGEALDQTRLFPVEYIEMIHTGEESGKMPEMFDRMARIYSEKADLAVRALVSAIGWTVWVAVDAVIIYYIFSFAMSYMRQMSELTRDL